MVSGVHASNSTAAPPLPVQRRADTTAEAIWEPLFNDVWVARINDTFVGMIQRVGTVFKLTDATGCLIGRFQSIYEARNALVGGW